MNNEGETSQIISSLNDESLLNESSTLTEKRRVTLIDDNFDENLNQTKLEEPSKISLSPEQLAEFFSAVEENSVDRLEELFDSIENVDPNMTRYTESLLMSAIRNKRPQVAEYLIDQLGVDVNHRSQLYEFRPQTRMPIRQRPMTCRELAYERGMMDLVDLIDLTSDETRPGTKRFLHRRLQTRIDEIHQSSLKRFKERNAQFLVPTGDNDRLIVEEESEIRDIDDSFNNLSRSEKFNDSKEKHAVSLPAARVFRSRIEDTVKKIDFSSEKPIDDSGTKKFRYSGYKLRFRLEEDQSKAKATPRKPTSPFALLQEPTSPSTTTLNTSLPSARPRTTVRTATARSQRSIFDLNSSLPIRENRTSICRSARRIQTPRVSNEQKTDNKDQSLRPPSHRLLPKRPQKYIPDFSFVSVHQSTPFYKQSTHNVPLTLKSMTGGFTSERTFIRD